MTELTPGSAFSAAGQALGYVTQVDDTLLAALTTPLAGASR
jgi:hypothetical protein